MHRFISIYMALFQTYIVNQVQIAKKICLGFQFKLKLQIYVLLLIEYPKLFILN